MQWWMRESAWSAPGCSLCWFKPGSVQRGADKGHRPLTEHVAGHAYMASHLACAKGAISMQTR